jgi:hypothetical protein
MTTLVGTELRRLLARRLTKLFAALAILAVVVTGLVVFFRSNRDLAPARARAEQQRQEVIRFCLEDPSEFGGPGIAGEAGFDAQRFCEERIGLEVGDPRFHLAELVEIFKGTAAPLVILGWLLGASFIGGDWRAGTVTTELTWEPRRLRLFVAKAFVCVLVAFAWTIVFQALLGGALVPAAAVRGTTAGTGAAWLRELAGVSLRAGAVSALGALIGFSVAAVGRNTAAALGAGFAYLAVIEGILRGVWPGWSRWFVGDNAALFVDGRDARFPPIGRSVAGAGILLSIYALALLAVATAQFRARDVT